MNVRRQKVITYQEEATCSKCTFGYMDLTGFEFNQQIHQLAPGHVVPSGVHYQYTCITCGNQETSPEKYPKIVYEPDFSDDRPSGDY